MFNFKIFSLLLPSVFCSLFILCYIIRLLPYSVDAVNRSPNGAGHLNKIKYTGAQLGVTAILGCCKGHVCAILWVLVIKGTFQDESEMNRGVNTNCKVKRIVKRLSCNVTEVELKGTNITMSNRR